MKVKIIILLVAILLLLCFVEFIFSAEGDDYEPLQLKATTDASVLFYFPGIDVGFTAVKSNSIPSLIMKSVDKKSFKIVNLSSVTLNEAINQEGKVIAFLITKYSITESGLIKINSLIKNGSVEFEEMLNTLQENDFTINTIGSKKPPNPKEFVKLRNAFVYDFMIEDSKKQQFPMQLYVETFSNASELE